MTANIKYKTTRPGDYADHDVDESISAFVFSRLSNETIADLVELLVVRGVLSRREVFDVFKNSEDYLG